MEEKTVGMIRYLKHHSPDYPNLMETAIGFMMQYSGCPREVYTPEIIHGIVLEVFKDFINAVDRPSYVIFLIAEAMKIHKDILGESEYTIYDGMLSAMDMIEVRNDKGEYVNGFKPEHFF